MERKWISVLACFGVLSLSVSTASAIIFSSNATIGEGNVYSSVDIEGDSTTVEMTGGSVGQMVVSGSSALDMSGGEILDSLSVRDSATANISGGSISELFAIELSVIKLHGFDVVHHATGGKWDDGKITGKWLDGTGFDISFYNSGHFGNDTFSHLKILPEPATLILMGVGLTLIRTRRCSRKS